jgi:hypothetical protein
MRAKSIAISCRPSDGVPSSKKYSPPRRPLIRSITKNEPPKTFGSGSARKGRGQGTPPYSWTARRIAYSSAAVVFRYDPGRSFRMTSRCRHGRGANHRPRDCHTRSPVDDHCLRSQACMKHSDHVSALRDGDLVMLPDDRSHDGGEPELWLAAEARGRPPRQAHRGVITVAISAARAAALGIPTMVTREAIRRASATGSGRSRHDAPCDTRCTAGPRPNPARWRSPGSAAACLPIALPIAERAGVSASPLSGLARQLGHEPDRLRVLATEDDDTAVGAAIACHTVSCPQAAPVVPAACSAPWAGRLARDRVCTYWDEISDARRALETVTGAYLSGRSPARFRLLTV